MGNAMRKMLDRVFGNKEMRVGKVLSGVALPCHVRPFLVDERALVCLLTGGHAWTGRSRQNNDPIQTPHWGDSEHGPNNRC